MVEKELNSENRDHFMSLAKGGRISPPWGAVRENGEGGRGTTMMGR